MLVSSFKDFLYNYENFQEELPVHFSEECNKYKDEIKSINKNQATEDIYNLFSLLKFGYAGYSYFGGDKIFYKARDNMLDHVNKIEQKEIPKELLTEIIKDNLSFIQDSHFAIENHQLCKYTKYFSTKDYTFFKDFKGYYTYIDDQIYYLVNVNNDRL